MGKLIPGLAGIGRHARSAPGTRCRSASKPRRRCLESGRLVSLGRFRAFYAFDFIYAMETENDAYSSYPYENPDMYIWMAKQGNAEHGLGARLDERHEMWHRIIENPSYGPYWRDVAADQWFDQPPRLVPALHVHSLWDEEDIYGSPAVYAALEKHDAGNDTNFFVAGPWTHGGHFRAGNTLGDISFDEDTGKRYREDVLLPFLRRYLHDDKDIEIAPVTVFETGSNRWRHFDQWPPPGDQARLYLQAEGGLAFNAPTGDSAGTEFLSDPEHPVPYGPRPNAHWEDDAANEKWERWLIEDQRFVDDRPDVATWISEPLEQPLTIRGAVSAHLFAETTGTDADWVVKLIDVHPYDNKNFAMSGFQMMISADIFRGRYREDLTTAKPIKANTVLEYTLPLPHVNHTILPGHRLMVQVQSTWYPLYDLNPQTFVPSIMSAPDDAYKKQQHRVHHSAEHATYLEFRVDTRPKVEEQ
jgi:putative CocE/NonD family hydrolase